MALKAEHAVHDPAGPPCQGLQSAQREQSCGRRKKERIRHEQPEQVTDGMDE
jgi:hypothetical protein